MVAHSGGYWVVDYYKFPDKMVEGRVDGFYESRLGKVYNRKAIFYLDWRAPHMLLREI